MASKWDELSDHVIAVGTCKIINSDTGIELTVASWNILNKLFAKYMVGKELLQHLADGHEQRLIAIKNVIKYMLESGKLDVLALQEVHGDDIGDLLALANSYGYVGFVGNNIKHCKRGKGGDYVFTFVRATFGFQRMEMVVCDTSREDKSIQLIVLTDPNGNEFGIVNTHNTFHLVDNKQMLRPELVTFLRLQMFSNGLNTIILLGDFNANRVDMLEQLRGSMPEMTINSIGNYSYTHSTNAQDGTWSGFVTFDEPVVITRFEVEFYIGSSLEDTFRANARRAYKNVYQ